MENKTIVPLEEPFKVKVAKSENHQYNDDGDDDGGVSDDDDGKEEEDGGVEGW